MSEGVRGGRGFAVYKQQADAVIAAVPPALGTPIPFTMIPYNVRLIGATIECTWTVQPDPLEIHVVVDGVTFTFKKNNPVSATRYGLTHMDLEYQESSQSLYAGLTTVQAFVLEGRHVAIGCEVTGGTVSRLDARLRWARIE